MRRFLQWRDPDGACNFCSSTQDRQVDIDDLFDSVRTALAREYEDPERSDLIWDAEDGAWSGVVVLETADVLCEVGSPLAGGESALQKRFCESVDHRWYRRDSEAGTQPDRMIWGWRAFDRRIRSGPRFLFLRNEADVGEPSIDDVFFELARCVAHIGPNLVKVAMPGHQLIRARLGEHNTAVDLGSPPLDCAGAQRLSPPGVSYFYAAETPGTARSETRAKVGERISLGTWTSTRPMRYIDLAEPVRLPSIFDLIFDHQRSMVRFLNQFGIEISKPLDDESTPAVDYLATQIVSEYFRWYLPTSAGPGVDAIRFRSALTEGGINWAICRGPRRMWAARQRPSA